ncbi:uncharacterized protein LOC128231706 [Mya arenaria]|uniref:uncharacterized protein LOC128231706 n=1 Tax=Mya arenaria TaxID=6604 RepID=UPI0022E72BC4|nr:uncharacterized protein LOC128231706 [Mya arenaria]XP_052800778.1 uncharacterized protein LOC128231706 [Mya arenaria]
MGRVWCIVLIATVASQVAGQNWMRPAETTTPTTTTTTEPPPSPEQIAMNKLCEAKCRTEVCYLPDNKDCRNFIVCDQDALGQYFGSLQPCAFGTFWSGFDQTTTFSCAHPASASCSVNFCSRRSAGDTFSHTEPNCKTYWECKRDPATGILMPKPSCCKDGFMFNGVQCVVDNNNECHDICPLTNEAAPCIDGSPTFHSDDGNCRTYWKCNKTNPLPVCCSEGKGYDVATGTCAANGCRDSCPPQYQTDACLNPSVKNYDIFDNHCRTYMRCKKNGEPDERWCCPSQQTFNPQTQQCESTSINDICDDYCPQGYLQVCPLEPSSSGPNFYSQAGLDGTTSVMKCAPGTTFSKELCGCGMPIENAPDNSCNMELDIVFNGTVMERRGSQNEVQIMRNSAPVMPGDLLDGTITFGFDGNLKFKLPFAQQTFENVYAMVLIKPRTRADTNPQPILSNCMNNDLGDPTFELILANGLVVVSVTTENRVAKVPAMASTTPAKLSLPFQTNTWQMVTVIYDGATLRLAVATEQRSKQVDMSLVGSIPVAAQGLQVGGCEITGISPKLGQGYVGSMAKFQFSKCLRKDWLMSFYKAHGIEPPQPPQPEDILPA